MENVKPGRWTEFSFDITPEARHVFLASTEGIVGVDYTPIAFATQVVTGTNYCFLCKAKGVYPDATDFAVKLYIYQPLSGAPHIVVIDKVCSEQRWTK